MTPGTDRIERPGSRAVLIGVSTYQDPAFPFVPAAEKSLRGVHQMLVDQELGGWSVDQVFPILNPDDCRRVMRDLRHHALNTTGVLLVYFVGHGTLTTKGDLVLAVSDTVADEPDITGLEYEKIRSVLHESPARVKAVVLDCCYSGRIIKVLGGDQQHLANITDVQGTYTLTAADLAADAGQDDTCTPFTGELLDLIGAGVAGGPPVLTFADVYPRLRQRLLAHGLPRPNQRGTDTADKCPVAKNASGKTVNARQVVPSARLRASDPPVPMESPAPPLTRSMSGIQHSPGPDGPFSISWTGKEPLSAYADTRPLRVRVNALAITLAVALVGVFLLLALVGPDEIFTSEPGHPGGWMVMFMIFGGIGVFALGMLLLVVVMMCPLGKSSWSLEIGRPGIRTTGGFGKHEYRWSHVQTFIVEEVLGSGGARMQHRTPREIHGGR